MKRNAERTPEGKGWKRVVIPLASLCLVALGIGAVWLLQNKLPAKAGKTLNVASPVAPQDVRQMDWEEGQKRREENRISPEFQTAVNLLAKDFGAALSPEFEENSCYSPLSLYYALSMLASGAGGETEELLLSALHASDSQWLAEQCGRFYIQAYRNSEESKFQLSNSLWLLEDFPFENSYVQSVASGYYASLFSTAPGDPGFAQDVEEFISEQTEGFLKPKLPYEEPPELLLLNTLYLKGAWHDSFSPERTEKDSFKREDGTELSVDFMNRTDDLASGYQGENFIRSSMAIQGIGEMVFVLPNEGVSPRELLENSDAFEKMFFPTEEDESYRVEWHMPKFSFTCDYNLESSLKAMGLGNIFSLEADFSGISPESLLVSDARQGTRVQVDEEGVEAAAYTAFAMEATGATPVEQTLSMDLSHPFLFAIRSTEPLLEGEGYVPGSTLLFVGICGDPSAE